MVTLRADELAELTPEEKRIHFENEAKNVFGHDYKRDKHGRPIEQGIGSAQQVTEAHLQALAKAEGQEVADRARADAIKRGTLVGKRNDAF
jgi:hypothetical protein